MKSLGTSVRHFFSNLVCMFIRDDARRKTARSVLDSPFLRQLRFVHRDSGVNMRQIKLMTGFSGRNLIYRAGDKYVYKFVHKRKAWNYNIEQRERDISTAFARVSPLPLAIPTVLEMGKTPLRRYDVVPGLTLRGAATQYPERYAKNKQRIAAQIANFMYQIGQSDPAKIRKYKRQYMNPGEKLRAPGYMYGWYHEDIGDNFMIDPETFDIVAVIDLESMMFGDFSNRWAWDGCALVRDFTMCVRTHYEKIWRKNMGGRGR